MPKKSSSRLSFSKSCKTFILITVLHFFRYSKKNEKCNGFRVKIRLRVTTRENISYEYVDAIDAMKF